MFLSLSCSRKGAHKFPVYDIVIAYSSKSVQGWYMEKIGFYNPSMTEHFFFMNFKKLSFWLYKGVKVDKRMKKCMIYLSYNELL